MQRKAIIQNEASASDSFFLKNGFLSRKKEVLCIFHEEKGIENKNERPFLVVFHKSIEKAFDFSRVGI